MGKELVGNKFKIKYRLLQAAGISNLRSKKIRFPENNLE